jgi:DtxR family Mn-dependent transcriptional regulator
VTTANKEQYLESIHRLGGAHAPVGLSALADLLDISPVSTHEMIKKLAAVELVAYEPYRGVTLTSAGCIEALRLIRRHRLWERFLTDVLNLPWDAVHAEACRLEHATSALVEAHLARYLEEPGACPHGHPMPTADGSLDFEAGCPMTDVAPGEGAVVLRVPERDAGLLQHLAAIGLAPGATFRLAAVEPFMGPLTLQVGHSTRVIGFDLAARIDVRRGAAREACDV